MFDEKQLRCKVCRWFCYDEANLTDEMYENASMHNENGMADDFYVNIF